MTWIVVFKNPKRIEKAVLKLRIATKVAFKKAIEDLRVEGPRPQDWHIKVLRGNYAGLMSLRLDYRHRMIYEVVHDRLIITVIEVSTREEAYS
ncbi:MAG: hypothetical protein A3G32_06945 [Deltaproteobacteria bacterium RIFCSPLOWO2_12_FULL_40_28]|nr:MAG: hypothetical protein A3C45_06990 [Deltaproteobacteria bacterium RIFCSPHIGHO2_02_FULL_40_28]OGQ19307.1 MAG: hypothetical protein A3E27_04825 [Deltaproteobacteria bacterium RIFCSPHIGHO2_12_FULL_40_32]OGQ40469.1 MAG: hypothetical protein A3I69_00245 [Deltaproteobacteria bacterium RIFCSPLOWO2_02_FULL_40_36]OGQ53705.1 MAG: hypothetical protein A3G32_06945 [Deltaproteobacteria bacterium RIFCSPLOWO2_12_FULL_40_28]